jgi:hypothetical protein
MALEKQVVADKVEVVTGTAEDGSEVTHVQVRTATRIVEDGEIISSSYHRHVISAGDDYSSEPANVQAICNAVFGA